MGAQVCCVHFKALPVAVVHPEVQLGLTADELTAWGDISEIA